MLSLFPHLYPPRSLTFLLVEAESVVRALTSKVHGYRGFIHGLVLAPFLLDLFREHSFLRELYSAAAD